MTFPSPPPAAQNSIASGISQNSGARAGRAHQSVWGLPSAVSGTRRGLASLSTDLGLSAAEHSGGPASTVAASPFTSTFSSVVNSSARNSGSRTNYSASSSTPPFPPLQAGSQQPYSSQILSPRSRTITPSSNSYLASSAAASTSVSQGGGVGSGSGGGTARNQTFSPSLPPQTLSSPTNPTFERSAFTGVAPVPSSSGQSSVSKIVVTQVFLLLGSITEKEGKVKWDNQAEAIRKV
jgi:CCR4-NOT transcription complex subunit 1